MPIAFSLKEDKNDKDPLYPVESAIKTIVVENTFQNQDREAWPVFSNPLLSFEAGKVLVGDSVVVTGWAPWAYFIETKTSSGYVSWKSLKVTGA